MSSPGPGPRRIWLLVPLLIGAAYLVGALGLAPGSLERPGPGFFPLLAAGVLLVSTAVALAGERGDSGVEDGKGASPAAEEGGPSAQAEAQALAAEADEERGARTPPEGAELQDEANPRRVLAILGALGAYLLIASLAGHLLAAFVSAAIAIRALHARPWWQAALFAAAISGLSYGVFALGLGVQLPAGA